MQCQENAETFVIFPEILSFVPNGDYTGKPAVILSVDEYEALRLIDKEGFSQEQCGEQMNVARTTVQQIYASARKKLADVLVDGLPLRIEGGDYRLCNGNADKCSCIGCYKQQINRQYASKEGDYIMRIAVTYENGDIFQHFGRTEQFKVYDVQEGKINSSEVVNTNGIGHGALAGVLNALQADVLICGGIGGGAKSALAAAGIKLYGGTSGNADQAVEALLKGELSYNTDVQCNHHGEHQHEENFGEHGCGEHNCSGH